MVSLTIDVDRTKGANLKSRVELELECFEKDRYNSVFERFHIKDH